MLYAIREGEKVEAEKGSHATCPDCDGSMVPKCGRIISPHWAHRSHADCDNWSHGETEWHLGWKRLFHKDEVEVRFERDGKRHRSDVCLTTEIGGIKFIEFQHSSISVDDIEAREKFYGADKLLWVFDAQDSYEAHRIWIKDSQFTPTQLATFSGPLPAIPPYVTLKDVEWKRSRKSVAHCDATIVLDLGKRPYWPDEKKLRMARESGDAEWLASLVQEWEAVKPQRPHWLFKVVMAGLDDEGRMQITGYFRSKEQFVKAYCRR